MPFVAPHIREQAEAALQLVAQAGKWNIVSAGIAPLSGLPIEQGRFDADYCLRVHYQLDPENRPGYQQPSMYRALVLPGTRILLTPNDLSDYLSEMVEAPSMIGVRLTEAYILERTSDMLASNENLVALASEAAGNPTLRKAMYDGCGMHVDLARQYATGRLDEIRDEMIRVANEQLSLAGAGAAAGPFEEGGFGAFGDDGIAAGPRLHAAPPAEVEPARREHVLARGFLALAMQSQLAEGRLPPPAELDFSGPVKQMLGYSLTEALERTAAGTAPDLVSAIEVAGNHLRGVQYAAFPFQASAYADIAGAQELSNRVVTPVHAPQQQLGQAGEQPQL